MPVAVYYRLDLPHRSFSECFGPSSPVPMPAPLQAYLQHLQDQLLDALVFQSGSITYELLTAGGMTR